MIFNEIRYLTKSIRYCRLQAIIIIEKNSNSNRYYENQQKRIFNNALCLLIHITNSQII